MFRQINSISHWILTKVRGTADVCSPPLPKFMILLVWYLHLCIRLSCCCIKCVAIIAIGMTRCLVKCWRSMRNGVTILIRLVRSPFLVGSAHANWCPLWRCIILPMLVLLDTLLALTSEFYMKMEMSMSLSWWESVELLLSNQSWAFLAWSWLQQFWVCS